jgi:hypothetical protein
MPARAYRGRMVLARFIFIAGIVAAGGLALSPASARACSDA